MLKADFMVDSNSVKDLFSTAIPQILKGLDLSDPKKAVQELAVGMPVRAVFKEKREGRIEDFHVEPIR